MGERTKIVETETSGEYGEQVIVHGKTSGGVYKPIYIGDDGKVKIDPVPPDVAAIADGVWDEALSGHTTAGSAGKKLGDIPTTAMRGTDNALLAGSYETERGTNNAALASVCTEGRLAALDTVIAEIDANETKIDTVDTVVDAIKVITDKLYTKNDVTPYYKTYPAGAAPTGISSSTTAWSYGSWAEVIAANAINTTFALVGYMLIHEEAASVSAQLSIGIGAAASETEIMYLPYRHAYVTAQGSIIFQTVMLPILYRIVANTRVAARIRNHGAVARSYNVYLLVVTGGL